MARFQLDHNVSHQLAQELRRLGHDVVTAWDLGLQEADDDVHLATAANDGRIFVTHNGGDFRLLHKAWRRWSRMWRVQESWTGVLGLLGGVWRRSRLRGVQASHAGVLIVPQRPLVPVAEMAVLIDAFVETAEERGRALTDELYTYDHTAGTWLHEPVLSHRQRR